MIKIAYKNIGCKVNQYELNKIESDLSDYDLLKVDFNDFADIYIINTCSVTHIADKKSRQMVHRAYNKNNNAIIIVTGCSVDNNDIFFDNEIENVIIVNNKNKKNIKEILTNYLNNHNIEYRKNNQSIVINNKYKKVRSFIKIEDGCNQFCSYCIIPYLRGRVKSYKEEDILNSIKNEINKGIVEVVITGIHLSSYSLDFKNLNYENEGAIEYSSNEIVSLLKKIYLFNEIKRIRLGSLEPRLITDNFLNELYKIQDKFCPEFHLSLQSGCDKILKLMNRHYTVDDYFNITKKIRNIFKDSIITTDIIVGFPSENENDFLETVNFCKEIKFYNPNIFKYSKRKGTKAYDFKEQIDENIKNIRSNKLINITNQISNEIRDSFVNKEIEVLIEDIKKENNQTYLTGYTKEYIDTKIYIKNCSEEKYSLGDVIKIKSIKNENNFLIAEI